MSAAPHVVTSQRGGAGEPLVLLHGFTDTWHTWNLLRAYVEPHYDVFTPALAGHQFGRDVRVEELSANSRLFADDVERQLDEAGIGTAHVVGNSLGGYVAMHLAERGRARTVTTLAPAGGWGNDASYQRTVRIFRGMQRQLPLASMLAPLIAATPWGRRVATRLVCHSSRLLTRTDVVQMIRGAHACSVAGLLLDVSDEVEWEIDAAKITCPVQIVWGLKDRILQLPDAAARHRERFPDATWRELDGMGHGQQLDRPDAIAELVHSFVSAHASV